MEEIEGWRPEGGDGETSEEPAFRSYGAAAFARAKTGVRKSFFAFNPAATK